MMIVPGPNSLAHLAAASDDAAEVRRRAMASVRKDEEHQEQSLLFQWIDLQMGRIPELENFYAVPNFSGFVGGEKARLAAGARLKREGRRKGVPDVNGDVARGGYHGLRIEMKTDDGVLSADQKRWHKRLRAAGYRVEVCRTWEAARDVILGYLGVRG